MLERRGRGWAVMELSGEGCSDVVLGFGGPHTPSHPSPPAAARPTRPPAAARPAPARPTRPPAAASATRAGGLSPCRVELGQSAHKRPRTSAWGIQWYPPPPCACTALSKHGVGVEPPF